jgi:hypothetical protein
LALGKKIKTYQSKLFSSIVIMEDNGTLLKLKHNRINLKGIAQQYYKNFKDDRDFLLVFSQGKRVLKNNLQAYFTGVKNNIEGIGLDTFDRTDKFGSKGRLQGMAFLNGTAHWTNSSLNYYAKGVFVHELGHRWIAHLDKKVNGVRLTRTRKQGDTSHWQPLVHNGGSMMYGNKWKSKGGRNYVSQLAVPGFTALDKYLMGILPASKVKDFFVIDATKSTIRKNYPMPLNTATGKKVKITIKDIQKVYGKRNSTYKTAQKRFRARVILVVPKGESLKVLAVNEVNSWRKRIADRMSKATDGKFEFNTDVHCSKDKHCAESRFCSRGFLGLVKQFCNSKRKSGKSCTRGGQCKSGKCKGLPLLKKCK